MKLLDSKSLLSGSANLKVQPGQYAALMIYIAGTTAAADASAVDVGLVTAYWRNRPFSSIRFVDLQAINKMELGQVLVDNTTPFEYAATLLASRSGDRNIFDVIDADQMHLTVDLSGAGGGTGAAWTGGDIYLYGIPADGIQMYLPQLFTHTDTINNGATKVMRMSYENMTHLFVITTTNLSRLAVTVDGVSLVDGTAAAIQAWSNMDARLESAFTEGFMLNLHRSGSVAEALSDAIVLQASASGGAANPIFIAAALDYTPDVLARSKRLVLAKADAKFKRKASEDKTRPVQVAEALR